MTYIRSFFILVGALILGVACVAKKEHAPKALRRQIVGVLLVDVAIVAILGAV